MDEITWKKYNIKTLEDKVMQIMRAADSRNDRLYGHLGAELITEISEKVDEIIADLTNPIDKE